jgi:hypothetical protein
MNFDQALAARLLSNAGVAALVATRVDWERLPQDSLMPAIVLTIVVDQMPQTMKGFQSVRGTATQIDCYGDTKAQAVALRKAALAAVVPAALIEGVRFQQAQDVSVRRDYRREAAFERYREIIDLTLWHNS